MAKAAAKHKSAKRKAIARKSRARRTTKTAKRGAAKKTNRWSAHVNETSDAMDLKHHLFTQRDPAAIARSLKRSAERSHRRKAAPYQSAMSMLNFYINRGGKNLSAAQKGRLQKAKGELRKAFGRE